MPSANKGPTGFNNIPYQLILPYLNFQQISALAMSSPDFRRWFQGQSPRTKARLIVAYRNQLLSTRRLPGVNGRNKTPLSVGNRKFLESRNFPGWRAEAYKRGINQLHNSSRIELHRAPLNRLLGITPSPRGTFWGIPIQHMRNFVPPHTVRYLEPTPYNTKNGRPTASAVRTPGPFKNAKLLAHLGVRNKVLAWAARHKKTRNTN